MLIDSTKKENQYVLLYNHLSWVNFLMAFISYEDQLVHTNNIAAQIPLLEKIKQILIHNLFHLFLKSQFHLFLPKI